MITDIRCNELVNVNSRIIPISTFSMSAPFSLSDNRPKLLRLSMLRLPDDSEASRWNLGGRTIVGNNKSYFWASATLASSRAHPVDSNIFKSSGSPLSCCSMEVREWQVTCNEEKRKNARRYCTLFSCSFFAAASSVLILTMPNKK